jgi:uncharacterized membrane protein
MIWIGFIGLVLLNVFIAFIIKMSRKTSYWGRVVLMVPPIAIIYGVATLLLALFYLTKYYLKD